MYHTILVPLDGTQLAEKELNHAMEVLPPCGVLHLLRVTCAHLLLSTPAPAILSADIPSKIVSERLRCQRYLEEVKRKILDQHPGLRVKTHVRDGLPQDAIQEVARECKVQLVVMSARQKHWLERLIFGSTTEDVVRQLRIPVMVVHEEHGPVPEAIGRRERVATA